MKSEVLHNNLPSLSIKTRSIRKFENFDSSVLNLDTLPSSKIFFNLGLARVVPFAVSVLVILVFLVLFTILVIVHKKKNKRDPESKDVEIIESTSREGIDPVEDQIRSEEMMFMRKVFPHIISFPNDDPGLNL